MKSHVSRPFECLCFFFFLCFLWSTSCVTRSVDFVVTSSEVVTSLFFGDALVSGVDSTGLVCFIVVCDDLALFVTLGTSSATR